MHIQHRGGIPASLFLDHAATNGAYTLSLHDALPISIGCPRAPRWRSRRGRAPRSGSCTSPSGRCRSEEHTSELQSRLHLVCRLLLEKNNEHTNHVRLPADRIAASGSQFSPVHLNVVL